MHTIAINTPDAQQRKSAPAKKLMQPISLKQMSAAKNACSSVLKILLLLFEAIPQQLKKQLVSIIPRDFPTEKRCDTEAP